ncbi:MAG: hypothetical protein F6K58_00975 [Symploca sp. SIO2E9]|nr:hypothetical protein [Symploca sp. SIO2E9]
MNEKKGGGTSKQTLQTLQTLQTRRIKIPTKISLTREKILMVIFPSKLDNLFLGVPLIHTSFEAVRNYGNQAGVWLWFSA